MAQGPSLAAIGLSVVSLGLAGYALARSPASPEHADARISDLESEVAGLRAQLARVRRPAPTLTGRVLPETGTRAASGTRPPASSSADGSGSSRSNPASATSAEVDASTEARIKDLVDASVERKTEAVLEDMRIKRNKKPPIDVLAKTLELDEEQVQATRDEVIRGQREAYDLLEVPTSDGVNLMEELVDIVATSLAKPGKDAGWGEFVKRLTTERVPGRDETYAVAIEGVKSSMRQTFGRIWNQEQAQEFQAWGADPLEIGDVPGSPRQALQRRIRDRARDLGAQLPDEE